VLAIADNTTSTTSAPIAKRTHRRIVSAVFSGNTPSRALKTQTESFLIPQKMIPRMRMTSNIGIPPLFIIYLDNNIFGAKSQHKIGG